MADPVPPNYWQLAGLLGRGAAPIGTGLMGAGQNMIDRYQAMPSWADRASEQLTDPRSAVAQLLDPARIETAMGMVGPGTTKPVGKGITAYHGSPHDFERFDMSRIGSGEGAQAYGHGLYFAENEGVAKQYRDNLAVAPKANSWNWNPDGTPNRAGQVASELDASISDADIRRGLQVKEPNATPAQLDEWMAKGRDLYGEAQKSGKTYQVAINADPEHFLHWDKPLSEQSAFVQDRLKDAVQKEAYNRALASTSKTRADELWAMVKDPLKAPAGFAQQLLQKPEFTQQLREAGIPGIKYLDQGSRFQPQQVEHLNTQIKGLEDMLAGASETKRPGIEAALKARRSELSDLQPTHNYVVFDDKMIDILKKYGLAGLGIPGLGAAAQDNRQ